MKGRGEMDERTQEEGRWEDTNWGHLQKPLLVWASRVQGRLQGDVASLGAGIC